MCKGSFYINQIKLTLYDAKDDCFLLDELTELVKDGMAVSGGSKILTTTGMNRLAAYLMELL